MSNSKPKILIVDDQPINIKIVQRKIEKAGMEVLVAGNGHECLDIVGINKPDIILLDIMMPEMDGIETCEKLKENQETADIPIIFITAKSAKEDVLAGLDTGAVDYITKPLELDETLARIRTQLRVQEMHRENLDLMDRLGEMRKASTVGAITQGIAHNLNNLLGVVVGYIDLMKIGKNKPELVDRSINSMESAITRMVTIVSQLSSMAAQEDIHLTQMNFTDLYDNTIKRFYQELGEEVEVTFNSELPADFKLKMNSELFEGAIVKLLINAWESYLPEAEVKPINVEVSLIEGDEDLKVGSQFLIEVFDSGTGIDDEVKDNFFEPFITTKTSVGRGMGLTVARHALRDMNCELTVGNRPEGGVCAKVKVTVS